MCNNWVGVFTLLFDMLIRPRSRVYPVEERARIVVSVLLKISCQLVMQSKTPPGDSGDLGYLCGVLLSDVCS